MKRLALATAVLALVACGDMKKEAPAADAAAMSAAAPAALDTAIKQMDSLAAKMDTAVKKVDAAATKAMDANKAAAPATKKP